MFRLFRVSIKSVIKFIAYYFPFLRQLVLLLFVLFNVSLFLPVWIDRIRSSWSWNRGSQCNVWACYVIYWISSFKWLAIMANLWRCYDPIWVDHKTSTLLKLSICVLRNCWLYSMTTIIIWPFRTSSFQKQVTDSNDPNQKQFWSLICMKSKLILFCFACELKNCLFSERWHDEIRFFCSFSYLIVFRRLFCWNSSPCPQRIKP